MHLPEGSIACAHACTCNPRKIPHYPEDWYVFITVDQPHPNGSVSLYHNEPELTQHVTKFRTPQNCPFTSANHHTGSPAPITPSSPPTHHLLNSGTVILTPSKPQFDALIDAIETHPDVPHMVFPDQDILAVVYRGKWKPLPYHYNALKPMRDCHARLWKDEDVKVLHYILNKPWESRQFDADDKVESTHRLWWEAWEEVEREWTGYEAGEERRRLFESVVRPVVAQE